MNEMHFMYIFTRSAYCLKILKTNRVSNEQLYFYTPITNRFIDNKINCLLNYVNDGK